MRQRLRTGGVLGQAPTSVLVVAGMRIEAARVLLRYDQLSEDVCEQLLEHFPVYRDDTRLCPSPAILMVKP
jgi:hypothetical protein